MNNRIVEMKIKTKDFEDYSKFVQNFTDEINFFGASAKIYAKVETFNRSAEGYIVFYSYHKKWWEKVVADLVYDPVGNQEIYDLYNLNFFPKYDSDGGWPPLWTTGANGYQSRIYEGMKTHYKYSEYSYEDCLQLLSSVRALDKNPWCNNIFIHVFPESILKFS